MFRIDRRLVNIASVRAIHINKESSGAGAAGDEYPDAAASAARFESESKRESELDARAQAVYEREQAFEQEMAEELEQVKARAEEIIREAEEQAGDRARHIIDEAHNEAADLLYNAREEVEQDRVHAMQEGFAQGAGEGRRSYDEQLAAKLREDDEALKRVIEELYAERAQTYESMEEDIIGLSVEIVRKLLSPSPEETGAFRSLIQNALAQINPEGKTTIRLSPSDYERFFSSGSATFDVGPDVTVTASVLRDASLTEGDCVIDTEESTINAGLESQLKIIELAFNRIRG